MRLPVWLINIYSDALPKLKASEALEAVSVHMVGACTLEKEERKSVLRRWKEIIFGKQERKKLTPAQQDLILASMGIKVERIKK